MTFTNCGSPAVELVDEAGGTEAGRFVERYECEACGVTGRVRGDAAAPAVEWSRTDTVFEASESGR